MVNLEIITILPKGAYMFQKLILSLTVLAATTLWASTPQEPTLRFDNLKILILQGAANGAGYITIENEGNEDENLTGLRCEFAERTELHDHIPVPDQKDVMQMVEVEAMPIKAKSKLELKRGGKHLMFFGIKVDKTQGDTLQVTLTFKNAGEKTLTFQKVTDVDSLGS